VFMSFCRSSDVILRYVNTLNVIRYFLRTSLLGDRVVLETENGRPQSLASMPFLFQTHVVRFGLRTPGVARQLANAHVIRMVNPRTGNH